MKDKKQYEGRSIDIQLDSEIPFFGRVSRKGGHVYFQNTEKYPVTLIVDLRELEKLISGEEDYVFMNVMINETD